MMNDKQQMIHANIHDSKSDISTNSNDRNTLNDDSEALPKYLSMTLDVQTRIEPRNVKKIDRKFPDPRNRHADRLTRDNTVTWVPGDIPLVSNEYRRPRTAFEVINHLNVVRNITKCLKRRSIHVVYNESTASCKTSSYMKFTIRLLRQHNTDTILVDVRKRDGCALTFRDEYQAIHSAAVFGEIIPPEIPRSMPLSFDMECMQDKHIPFEADTIERSLETSIAHLGSKIYDTRMLAIHDLISMTNSSTIETPLKACRLMLEEKYLTIYDYVVSDIMKKVDYADCGNGDSDEYLRSLTLNLLGNILSSIQNNTNFVSIIQKRRYHANIIETLIWYAENAEKCPWNACLAVKCLRLLVPISVEARSSKALDSLYDAEKVGKCSHDLLERETVKALASVISM